MLAAFVLFLREGFEASLIVSILIAALRQLGKTRELRAVWWGIGTALMIAMLGGIALYATIRTYDGSTFQTIFETGTYLLAVAILTMMTFWMQSHSRTLKKEITLQASAAGSGVAMFLLAFTTVGREAVETMVFTLAFAFQTNGVQLLIGGVLGILASLALSILIYRFGYRLDYRIFFRIMGIVLLIFAAGLLGDAVQNMQELGWISFGTTALWHTGQFLSEDSTIGDILHTFLGYAEAPTILQAGMYVIYLLITGTLFGWLTRKPSTVVPIPSVPNPEHA